MKELFPEIVTEGKVDFEKLKIVLGTEIDSNNERYNLTWNGKARAIISSQTSSLGTLRPCKEKSINWDETKNIYIEGDNLEVLKLLQKSYHGKVNVIYIDPPYNTGEDFIYPDNYADSIRNYKLATGQMSSDKKMMGTNNETNGRFHTNWLNMMYPRLKLARNLLADDGVIFISIGDEEVNNLKFICNEIFGENNFRNQIAIRRGAKSVQAQFDTWDKLGQGLEYILFYTKNADYRFPRQMKELSESRNGTWNNHWRGTDRPTMRYELFGSVPETGQWRWGKDRSLSAISNYNRMLEETGCTENTVTQDVIDRWYESQGDEIDLLRISSNGKPEHYIPSTNETLLNSSWMDLLVGSSSEIMQLFHTKVFDTAKSSDVISRMLNFSKNDALVLDFFSGSGTTAQATIQSNSENGGSRHFILVQLPEPTYELDEFGKKIPKKKSKEAFTAGYDNICEIGEERIRRVGNAIVANRKQKTLFGDEEKIDYGFKVFKLDSSNIKAWNPDADNLKKSLSDFEDNLKSDDKREELDIVYEILLKMGLKLTSDIETIKVGDSNLYSVSSGALIVYLGEVKSMDIAQIIIKVYKENEPSLWKVAFRDNGFANDDIKANTRETLRAAGLQDGSFVTL